MFKHKKVLKIVKGFLKGKSQSTIKEAKRAQNSESESEGKFMKIFKTIV